jgi:hypothetical protein
MIVAITVEGEEHVVDLEKELTIAQSFEKDRDEVPAKIAFWGAVWAAATFEVDVADIAYRSWWASSCLNVNNSIDPTTGKPMSQYKTEYSVEQDPTFRVMKMTIAEAQMVANKAKVLHEAYLHKSMILAKLSGRNNWEAAAGFTGKYEEPPFDADAVKTLVVDQQGKRAERAEAVKNALKKGAKNGE